MIKFSESAIKLLDIPQVFISKLCSKNDDKPLKTAKRNHVESKVQELAKKLGINKPIKLIENDRPTAETSVEPFSGRAILIFNSDFVDSLPESMLEFIIAHELSHVKSNDVKWTFIALTAIHSTLVMSILFPLWNADFPPKDIAATIMSSPAALVGLSVCGIASIAFAHFCKWGEECADKLGFSVCSDAAQKAAPHFFDAQRRYHIELRNSEGGTSLSKMWRKFLITEDGELRFDVIYPPLKNRIKYLQAMLDKSS